MEAVQEEIKKLRLTMTQELCNLRHDIDVLQRGGWEVKVGAFQTMGEPGLANSQAIKKRILDLGSMNGTTGPGIADSATKNGTAHTQEMPLNEKSVANGAYTNGKSLSFPTRSLDPDEPVPSVEDPAAAAHLSFAPLVIRQSSPVLTEIMSGVPDAADTRTFSLEFIRKHLGGSNWSPGFYYISPSAGDCTLRSRSYYVLDFTVDPFLPSAPGMHGAKLIPIVRDSIEDDDPEETATKDVPLFTKCSSFAVLASKPKEEYIYFGNYSQLRFSDRLDYDRMVNVVSNEVKMYWAEQLADPTRPTWVTEALKDHFERKPEFKGKATESDVEEYAKELQEWEVDASAKMNDLTKEDVLKAFDSADCADPPGLRLWWEYLQCVGYDEPFYKTLIKKQDAWKKQQHI